MQDTNTANQGDLIFKLDQDRAWLLENLDKGKWPEIRSELAALERKISKFIIGECFACSCSKSMQHEDSG